MILPRHRWYAFKEGFSSLLVQRAIAETKQDFGEKKTNRFRSILWLWYYPININSKWL